MYAKYATWGRDSSVVSFIACLTVVLAADLGLYGFYDAAIVAFIFALVFPKISPFLLLTLTSIQDAPGMANDAWYVGFVLVGSITIIYGLKRTSLKGHDLLAVSTLGLAAFFVVLFSIAISLSNYYFNGHEQAFERNPLIVGGLMIFMTWAGIESAHILRNEPKGNKSITFIVAMLLAHGVGLALLQAFVDPMLMISSYGQEEIKGAAQLTQATSLGIPRIHGTFLSPNAFALCMTLLLMVALAYRKDEAPSIKFIVFWCAFGGVICLLSQSKSISIFFIITILLMVIQTKSWRVIIAFCMLCVLVLYLLISSLGVEDIASIFRISKELSGDSYRVLAWQSIISNLAWYDWITGVGLSHWPVFFDEHIGVRLSDPHIWLLSIPGTFGLPGLLFYFMVIYYLARVFLTGKGNVRVVAMTMLVLLVVKDMFSISYLLGNTPLSFLIWLIISLILNKQAGNRVAL